MSILDRIASARGRGDEAPNQELARELVEQADQDGIRELVANLWHADQDVRSDCLKTLYEVGYLRPEMIVEYAEEYLRLLHDRNNRMVWGGMIALASIASLRPDELYQHRQQIQDAMDEGSVITMDNGVKVLAAIAAADAYRADLLPYLFNHLQTCRLKDVPQHAEAIVRAVDDAHVDVFVAVLEGRLDGMNAAQAARLRKVIRQSQARRSARQSW
jgi:hypothetical protein